MAEKDIEVLVKERDLDALVAEVREARFMNWLQKVVIVLMLIASLFTMWGSYERKMLNQRYKLLVEQGEKLVEQTEKLNEIYMQRLDVLNKLINHLHDRSRKTLDDH